MRSLAYSVLASASMIQIPSRPRQLRMHYTGLGTRNWSGRWTRSNPGRRQDCVAENLWWRLACAAPAHVLAWEAQSKTMVCQLTVLVAPTVNVLSPITSLRRPTAATRSTGGEI
jgi:hypothetical protein